MSKREFLACIATAAYLSLTSAVADDSVAWRGLYWGAIHDAHSTAGFGGPLFDHLSYWNFGGYGKPPYPPVGEHDFLQGWYIQVGNSGSLISIRTLDLTNTEMLGEHGVRFEYEDPCALCTSKTLQLSTSYDLTEIGGVHLLAESIVIKNLTSSPLDLRLVLQTGADLDQNLWWDTLLSDLDTVSWVNQGAIRQTSPRGAVISTLAGGLTPDRYYMAATGNPETWWPTSEVHSLEAVQYVRWGWEWNLSIPDTGSGIPTALVSITNRGSIATTPEPATLFLVGLGIAGFAAARRRKK